MQLFPLPLVQKIRIPGLAPRVPARLRRDIRLGGKADLFLPQHLLHCSDNLHFLTGRIALPLKGSILNALTSFAGMVGAALIVDESHFACKCWRFVSVCVLCYAAMRCSRPPTQD